MHTIINKGRKRTKVCLSFQTEIQSHNCVNCGLKKPKYFADLAGKIGFELQITHMCQFHFNITGINVSAGRYRMTVNPKVFRLTFTFEKKPLENRPKRRSLRKTYLVTEFEKPKCKKSVTQGCTYPPNTDNSF